MNKDKLSKFKKQRVLPDNEIFSNDIPEDSNDFTDSENQDQFVDQVGYQVEKKSLFGPSHQGSIYQRASGQGRNRFDRVPQNIFDLKKMQPDDYQDDILENLSENTVTDNGDKEELMNNSVIELMMKNHHLYQKRDEFGTHKNFESKESINNLQYGSTPSKSYLQYGQSPQQNPQTFTSVLSNNNYDFQLTPQQRNIQSHQRMSKLVLDKNNTENQPRIHKELFTEVKRQQALEKLSDHLEMMQHSYMNEELQKKYASQRSQKHQSQQSQQSQQQKQTSFFDQQHQGLRSCTDCTIF